VEAVPRQLAGERLPGPLYCLMLYSSDFSDLEPILVGGLEARRGYLLAHPPGPMEPPGLDGEAIAEPGLGAGPSEREMLAYPLWNPLDEPRFQTYAAGKEPALVAGIVLDELAGDERFRDQCRQLWAHADAKSGDPIAAFARVLQGAAARLTALEWSKILPTTDDVRSDRPPRRHWCGRTPTDPAPQPGPRALPRLAAQRTYALTATGGTACGPAQLVVALPTARPPADVCAPGG